MSVEKTLTPDITLVCKLSKDGIINYVNKSYTDITGFSESELIGQSHQKIQHPELPQVLQEIVWDMIHQDKHTYFISKNITKNGEYFWTVADINPRLHEGRKTAIFIRRKFLPYDIKVEFEKLFKVLHEIEDQGGGIKVAKKYLAGWLEDRNSTFSDYIASKFGGEKNLKEYMTSEVSDEELFKIDLNEMKIDEILKTLKKKKRFGLF